MTRYLRYSLLIVVAVLTACSTKRLTYTPIAFAPDATEQQRVDALVATYGRWEQMSVPVKVNMRVPEEHSASGRLYMRRGRDIYMSMRVMGVEAGYIYVDPDSMYLVNKSDRSYVVEPLGRLLGPGNFTVSDIQDMIMGRIFVPGDSVVSGNDYVYYGGTEGFSPKISAADYSCIFRCTDDMIVGVAAIMGPGYDGLICEYSDPATTECGTVMCVNHMSGCIGTTEFDLDIKCDYRSVRWTDVNYRWKHPKNYRRISSEDMRSNISSASKQYYNINC